MLGFVVKRKARRQVRNDLQKLKKILENGAGRFDNCGTYED
jgi:hypothetical protein